MSCKTKLRPFNNFKISLNMFFQIECTPNRTCLVLHADKEGFEAFKTAAKKLNLQSHTHLTLFPIAPIPEHRLMLLDIEPKKVLRHEDETPFGLSPPGYVRNSMVSSLSIRWYGKTDNRILHATWEQDVPVLHVDERGWSDWLNAIEEAIVGPYLFFLTYKNPLFTEENYLFFDSQTVAAAVKKENDTIPAILFVRQLPEPEPWLHVLPGFWSKLFFRVNPGVIKGNIRGQEAFLNLLENAILGDCQQFELPYRDGKEFKSKEGKGEKRVVPLNLEKMQVAISSGPIKIEVVENCLSLSGFKTSLEDLLKVGKDLLWTCDEKQISGAIAQYFEVDEPTAISQPYSPDWPWVWRGGLVYSPYDEICLSYHGDTLPENRCRSRFIDCHLLAFRAKD